MSEPFRNHHGWDMSLQSKPASPVDDYAPTTADVRDFYAYGCGPEHTWDESREDFDRWLAEHDRQVAERAWDEGARWAAVECGAVDDERQAWIAPGDNPYTKGATWPSKS